MLIPSTALSIVARFESCAKQGECRVSRGLFRAPRGCLVGGNKEQRARNVMERSPVRLPRQSSPLYRLGACRPPSLAGSDGCSPATCVPSPVLSSQTTAAATAVRRVSHCGWERSLGGSTNNCTISLNSPCARLYRTDVLSARRREQGCRFQKTIPQQWAGQGNLPRSLHLHVYVQLRVHGHEAQSPRPEWSGKVVLRQHRRRPSGVTMEAVKVTTVSDREREHAGGLRAHFAAVRKSGLKSDLFFFSVNTYPTVIWKGSAGLGPAGSDSASGWFL